MKLRAQIVIDPELTIGKVERRLFGSFVEHLGRCVYDGIYEPGHTEANDVGFRQDVAKLVHEMGVSTIRYPGGNFVSGYRWEDGVGPREDRPSRLDLAWHSLETNKVGLDEFGTFCRDVDAELMLAVNLGTRGVAEALDLLEYANISDGTALSERRRRNGQHEPWNVRMWCLGNEMDGPWQIGHRDAVEYGRIASRTAKAMRMLDPNLELVACGSSGRGMPTFGRWERAVLDACYEDVDFISCHAYYEELDDDRGSFLASAIDMDAFIDSVAATIDHVQTARRSSKKVAISFDEWNVWYQERDRQKDTIEGLENWPRAPRLLENVYTVTDAIVVGSLIISLLNHADRVKAASLAQLVNVIAPIMTEPGGKAWRQTIFYPFALSSRLARGEALRLRLNGSVSDTRLYGSVPDLTAAGTLDRDRGTVTLLMANRSTENALATSVDIKRLGSVTLEEAWLLSDVDADACNTAAMPNRVTPKRLDAVLEEGMLELSLPPISWAAVSLNVKTYRDR
jgi:alpha-N-arabinofuranosidase